MVITLHFFFLLYFIHHIREESNQSEFNTISFLSAHWQCSNTTNRHGMVLFYDTRHQMALRCRKASWNGSGRYWTCSWKGFFSPQALARRSLSRTCIVSCSFPTLVYIFSFKILNIFGMRFKVDQFSILILASYIDIWD